MNRTVAILNQKGGVGKTTITLGLASAAAHSGRRILVIDLDPQASSTWVLGVDPDSDQPTVATVLRSRKPDARQAIVASAWNDDAVLAKGHIDVLPGGADAQRLETATTTKLRSALDPISTDYDAILIDCPPSLGALTRDALSASRHAIITVEPSSLGLRGIGGVADLIDDVWDTENPDLELTGVIVNRVPAVSSEAERRLDELARIVGRQTIWSPMIPQRVILNQAIGERQPIHAYGSRAADPIAAFDSLWRKLRTAIRRT